MPTRSARRRELELELQARGEAATCCAWSLGAPKIGRGGAERASELGEEGRQAATRDARRGRVREGQGPRGRRGSRSQDAVRRRLGKSGVREGNRVRVRRVHHIYTRLV